MDVKMEQSWKSRIAEEFAKEYFRLLAEFVKNEYQSKRVYPAPQNIFRAFDLCPFDAVKVVILGQDPYHGPRQANGLCFSVSEGITMPPSLQNIYKEIEDDLGVKMPASGNLERWAQQGVFLLNATLTVVGGQAGSHQRHGWEDFTDAAIRLLSERREKIVFMLWGRYAQAKGAMIDRNKHCILTAAHPSPLSAFNGFFGCRHFSKANEFLRERGVEPVQW